MLPTGEKAGSLSGIRLISFLIGVSFPLILPLIPCLQETYGFSNKNIELATGLYGIAQMAGLLFFGLATDKYSTTSLLKIAAGLFIVSDMIVIPTDIRTIYAHRLLAGLASGSQVVLFSAMARHTQSKQRARGMGEIIGFTILGTVVGSGTPTVIVKTFGIKWLFVIFLLISLLSLVVLYRFPKTDLTETKPSHKDEIRSWYSINTSLLLLLTIVFAYATAFNGLITVFSLSLSAERTAMDQQAGILISSIYLIGGIGTILLKVKKLQKKNDSQSLAASLIIAAIVFFSYIPLITAGNSQASAAYLVLLIAFVAITFADCFWGSLVSKVGNRRTSGKTMMLGMIAGSIGKFIGPLVIPECTNIWPNDPWIGSFLLAALLTELSAILALVLHPLVERKLKKDDV